MRFVGCMNRIGDMDVLVMCRKTNNEWSILGEHKKILDKILIFFIC